GRNGRQLLDDVSDRRHAPDRSAGRQPDPARGVGGRLAVPRHRLSICQQALFQPGIGKNRAKFPITINHLGAGTGTYVKAKSSVGVPLNLSTASATNNGSLLPGSVGKGGWIGGHYASVTSGHLGRARVRIDRKRERCSCANCWPRARWQVG